MQLRFIIGKDQGHECCLFIRFERVKLAFLILDKQRITKLGLLCRNGYIWVYDIDAQTDFSHHETMVRMFLIRKQGPCDDNK